MADRPINELMDSAMDNLKQMVDVNTIIGSPITTETGSVIIPVSKVSFGLVAGGSEFSAKNQNQQNPFGGGVGAGVTINPVAFLVANDDNVELLSVDDDDSASKLFEFVPSLVNKVSDFFQKRKNKSIEEE